MAEGHRYRHMSNLYRNPHKGNSWHRHLSKSQTPVSMSKWKMGGAVLESDNIIVNFFFSRSRIQNSLSLLRSSEKLRNARSLLGSIFQAEILYLWPVSHMARVPVFPGGQMTSFNYQTLPLKPPLTALSATSLRPLSLSTSVSLGTGAANR